MLEFLGTVLACLKVVGLLFIFTVLVLMFRETILAALRRKQ